MKSKEEIDELYHKFWDDFSNKYDDNLHYYSFVEGYIQCQNDMEKDVEYWQGEFDHWHQQAMEMADKKYTEEDMLNASKYGYEFRDTTSFPKHKFEDSCINNTKQWLEWYKNKQD